MSSRGSGQFDIPAGVAKLQASPRDDRRRPTPALSCGAGAQVDDQSYHGRERHELTDERVMMQAPTNDSIASVGRRILIAVNHTHV